MAQIFGRCWIYVGHSSELKKPGDFRSRKVAGRPVIFCRDQQGTIHCLFNTCRHRGAIVCTEREGNRRRFQCIYHGWTYGNDGRSSACPATTPMPRASTRRHTGCGGRRGSRTIAASGSCASISDARSARRLSRGRQGLYRPRHRPVAVRPDGDHRRRAGIRRRRQLEADGGEQRRRLSPAVDPFDLAQLHGQFGREDRAAEGRGPGAADPRQGGRARQRPFHHRQRQFPRPAGGQVDSALRRGGEGGDRRHPQRAGRLASARSGRSASPTPTATWWSSPIW